MAKSRNCGSISKTVQTKISGKDPEKETLSSHRPTLTWLIHLYPARSARSELFVLMLMREGKRAILNISTEPGQAEAKVQLDP